MAAYGLSVFLLTASGRIGFPRFFILNPGSLRAEGSTPRSDPKDPLVPSDPFPLFVCEAGPLGSGIYHEGVLACLWRCLVNDSAIGPGGRRSG